MKKGSSEFDVSSPKEQIYQKQISFHATKQWSRSIQVFPVFKTVLNDHFESSLSDESYSSCNKIELIRVGTFSKFPSENKPWYLGLARAGFFYTGESDIVECFHCHIKHGNWKARDDPFEVHRRISPGCEFINSKNSLNIPLPRTKEDDYSRRTLKKSNISTEQTEDKPTQNSSEGETGCISHACANQTMRTVTAQNSPNTNAPQIQHSRESENNVNQANLNNTHFKQQHPLTAPTAKYPEFSSQNVRASTFHGWPATTGQLPRRMAEAGFIYAGYSDYVRCFFCGEGLSEWERENDPWIEHAKWFPNCLFLRKSKGDNFIYLVRQSIQNQDQNPPRGVCFTNQEETSTGTPMLPRYSSAQLPSVSDDTSSAAVQSVQEMGYRRDVIDAAITSLQSEKKTINAHNIMVVILSSPDTSQNRNSESHSSSIPLPNSNENSLGTYESISSITDITNGYASSDTQGSSVSNLTSSTSTRWNSGSNDIAHAQTAPSPAKKDIDMSSQLNGLSLSDVQSMRNENRSLKESRLCKICQDNASTVVFVPCGHLVCCEECAYSMVKCPICRRSAEGRIKTWS